ncbi:MAG: glycosyltransferase, partial [Gammaproteobacteria bacterium]
DLVIDQVLAGWYGGFAVEVMAMGTPVAAYIRDADLACVPPQMIAELPVLRIDPRTLEGDLARLLTEADTWPAIGQRSRRFVERWHNPRTIASALQRCYRDPKAKLQLSPA